MRYADDANIFVRSERAGERVMAAVRRFLEKRLRLSVNEEKSSVTTPAKVHFLGFRFGRTEEGKFGAQLSAKRKAFCAFPKSVLSKSVCPRFSKNVHPLLTVGDRHPRFTKTD